MCVNVSVCVCACACGQKHVHAHVDNSNLLIHGDFRGRHARSLGPLLLLGDLSAPHYQDLFELRRSHLCGGHLNLESDVEGERQGWGGKRENVRESSTKCPGNAGLA